MPRDLSGNFANVRNFTVDHANSVNPTGARFDENFTDIATGITDSLDRLGRAPMRAALPMGGYKIQSLADGSAESDAATYGQLAGLGHNLDTVSQHVFYAKLHGIVANGTTDDRLALQTLIDNVNTMGGGIISLPGADIRLSSTLTLKSGVILQGVGKKTRLLCEGAIGVETPTLVQCFRASLRDLTIRNNKVTPASTDIAFVVRGSRGGYYADLTFENYDIGTICHIRPDGVTGQANCVWNQYARWHVEKCATGIIFEGKYGGALTPISNEAFYDINLVLVTRKGIEAIQWADTIRFYNFSGRAAAEGCILIDLNASNSLYNQIDRWQIYSPCLVIYDPLVPQRPGAITDISQSNPIVVTVAAHGMATGDFANLQGIGGMTQVNDRVFQITVLSADTFSIPENGSGYPAYTGGGTAYFNGPYTCTAIRFGYQTRKHFIYGVITDGSWSGFNGDTTAENMRFIVDENDDAWSYFVSMDASGQGPNIGPSSCQKGFSSEGSGTATIPIGATTVSITHGMRRDVHLSEIQVTPQGNMSGLSYWIADGGAQSFSINMSATSGTAKSFSWYVKQLSWT